MSTRGKVVVTGVAGFIGSHLAERLLSEGYQVVGIDKCQGDFRIKEHNLKGLLGRPGFALFREDLLTMPLKDVLMGARYIFHCAATPGVRSSWGEDFQTYVRNNILVTQRLLEAAREVKLEKFIYSSTSSVYGQVAGPAQEGMALRPLSPYGVSKLAGENLVMVYQCNFGVPAVALRYFTVFGPRQRPDMAFHKFIFACLTNAEISIYGDGEQKRDFTGVGDIVEANIQAARRPVQGEIINVGGGKRYTVNEVMKQLDALIGVSPRVNYLPPAPGEPRETWANLTKAQRLLGYTPKINLKQGLMAEIEDLRGLYGFSKR